MAHGEIGLLLGGYVQEFDLQVRRDRAAQARESRSKHLHQQGKSVEAVAPCSTDVGVKQDFQSMLEKEMGR